MITCANVAAMIPVCCCAVAKAHCYAISKRVLGERYTTVQTFEIVKDFGKTLQYGLICSHYLMH